MANDYITLTNSNASLSKRFYSQAMRLITTKTQNAERTIGGGLDLTEGGVYDIIRLTLVVPYSVTDVNYGTIANLKTFYSYNNPNGTPNNVLSLVDYFNVTHSVYFFGDLEMEPVCIHDAGIDGSVARYIVPVEFHVVPSGSAVT